jgi:hypothetical protein
VSTKNNAATIPLIHSSARVTGVRPGVAKRASESVA